MSEFNGMESVGRMALTNPTSTNTRYTTTLDNLEEHEQDVHEPITIVSGVADMQRQYN